MRLRNGEAAVGVGRTVVMQSRVGTAGDHCRHVPLYEHRTLAAEETKYYYAGEQEDDGGLYYLWTKRNPLDNGPPAPAGR